MRNAGRNMCSLAIVLAVLLQAGAAYPIAGQLGVEFAIDAPWRLEPVPVPNGGGNTYGPIPITITFHDAIYDHYRSSIGQAIANGLGITSGLEKKHVGTLKYVEVSELGTGLTRFQPENMREIERKRWISTKEEEPFHERCRSHLGQDCRPLYDITDSHEWHAMLWYTPRLTITPGRNIKLSVTVVTTYEGKERRWINGLVVHAGEAPLPRFSSGWLYGDLHYHSQMTDNEGESAYSYRNVVRTMGAMGLDFLFATDHASDSEQVDGGIVVARCGSVQGAQCYYDQSRFALNNCQEGGETKKCTPFGGTEARDLNQNRFTAAKQIIYGPDGANEAVARDADTGGIVNLRSRGLLPQIFMGEEVDAWPEMSRSEYETGGISYGDRQRYPWSNVSGCLQKSPYRFCTLYDPATLSDKFHQPPLTCTNKTIEQLCREHFSAVLSGPRYFTKDNQGIPHWDISPAPSRQHLVYFPLNGSPDGNGFVSSKSTTYGGASRPLDDVVREIESKGVTFLAHPLVGRKPGGDKGPDMVPYSQLSLDMAWRSRAVLGLQFWNENERLESKADEAGQRVYESPLSDGGKSYTSGMPFLGGGGTSSLWSWRWSDLPKMNSELYHGALTWDRYLRKGLDPGQTAQLSSWLPPGEPRKWFMAGGSDAHGDFNYRRDGYLCPSEWCEERVVDTAIGNPRNLVFVGPPTGPSIPGQPPGAQRRHANTQVITSLQAGNFSVTDGPALRIAIDKNRDGRLADTLDFPMGSTFHLYPNEQIPLLIEWISSQEFGRVAKIDVYVGTKERTYVPTGHGPSHTVCRGDADNDDRDDKGNTICDEAAGAYLPGWTVLQVDLTRVDPSLGYRGMAKIYLNPSEFGITRVDNSLFYVRAYAATFGRGNPASGCTDGLQGPPLAPLTPGKCGTRLAYSNPVWGRYIPNCRVKTGAGSTIIEDRRSIDGNNDGFPDTCQGPLPDLCPLQPLSGPLGGVQPPPLAIESDPAGTTSSPGSALRSCKIVTPPISLSGVISQLSTTTRAVPIQPSIVTRGVEEGGQPAESQEPDVLFIEEPAGSSEQQEGQLPQQPKDK